MFAYCLNSPVQYSDSSGTFTRIANPNAGRFDAHSPGGGGGGIILPLPSPALFDYLEEIADDVKTWVASQKGIKEYRDNSVYVLTDPMDNDLVKYVGRTNDPKRREWEHKNDLGHPWRKNYNMIVLVTGLTKNEAMLCEQFFISAYTVSYLENARREIAVRNISKYQSYVSAVTEIYTGIPGSEVSHFLSRR